MNSGPWRSLLAVLVLVPCLARAAGPPDNIITVFAAASLTDALQESGNAYTRQSGTTVQFSFAASSALARQIESGAHADVFFSADQEWMDYLDQRALILKSTRRDVLGNRLALIAPSSR